MIALHTYHRHDHDGGYVIIDVVPLSMHIQATEEVWLHYSLYGIFDVQ